MHSPKDRESRKLGRIDQARRNLLEGIGVPEATEFVPDKFQTDAIDALERGEDTLVIAPTGSGKTYIAREAIQHTVESGGRAVYTAPLKALSNSKYAEFCKAYEPEFSVGLLTGDRKIEGNADIVVATTEIYRNELYSFSGNYSLVVLDEFHYLADPQRGPVWEESIILSSRSSRLLMLSASISNPDTIANWIEDVRGNKVRVIIEEERAVPLLLGFLHPEHGVVPLEDEQGNIFPDVERFYRQEGPRMRRGFRGGRGGGDGRGHSAGAGKGKQGRGRGRGRKR
ncbi:MAG: DEAD/DEAH box helicase [Bdellovibrionales bacterium]|nr:DEAD/DEAH box helicase [Bdellovibrionales bacterium]